MFDPHYVRADARMAPRILSLGVISKEQSVALLRGAAKLELEHPGLERLVNDGAIHDDFSDFSIESRRAQLLDMIAQLETRTQQGLSHTLH